MTSEALASSRPGGATTTASVLRGGIISLVGGIVAAAGGFWLTVVVARGLGPTQAGVFFVSIGIFMILSNTLELGADTGLVRAIPRLRTLGRTTDVRRTLLIAGVPVLVAG